MVNIQPLKRLAILHDGNEQDKAEFTEVYQALHQITLIQAWLTPQNCPDYAWMQFSGPAPQAFWAKWIWVRIGPTSGTNITWLARISGVDPFERKLFFVPRPDSVDEILAKQARQSPHRKEIYGISLGLLASARQRTIVHISKSNETSICLN